MDITLSRCDGQPDETYRRADEAWRAVHAEYPDAVVHEEGYGEIESPRELRRRLRDPQRGGRILVWPTREDADGPTGHGDDGSAAYAEIHA